MEWHNNFSDDEINLQVVQAASCFHYPDSYRRLAFIFSGHGDAGRIYAHDSEVFLQKHIFDPWMPKNAPHLAEIPKLFFLDACRGDAVDQGVPIIVLPTGPVARGGRTSSVGNYLLAYSTMPSMKAFEQPAAGGYWLQHLVSELQKKSNIDVPLSEVLTTVNRKVRDEMVSHQCMNMQQPVVETTLYETLYLLREATCAGE